MPVLDRQAVAPGARTRPVPGPLPPSLAAPSPRSVPETTPTPLQRHYINLSVVALIAGAIGITALELGATFADLLVKACVLVAAPILALTTLDATIRIWRSAWAWMPVDRGRGLFRLSWIVASLVLVGLSIGALVVVLPA